MRPARPVIDLMALARSRDFNKFHDFNDVSCSFQLYFFLALGLISWHLFISFNLGTNPLTLFIKLSIETSSLCCLNKGLALDCTHTSNWNFSFFIQQIIAIIQIQLDNRCGKTVRRVFRCQVNHMLKKFWTDTIGWIIHFEKGRRPEEGVGLTRTCLSIHKDGTVDAIDKRLNKWFYQLTVHLVLRRPRINYIREWPEWWAFNLNWITLYLYNFIGVISLATEVNTSGPYSNADLNLRVTWLFRCLRAWFHLILNVFFQ